MSPKLSSSLSLSRVSCHGTALISGSTRCLEQSLCNSTSMTTCTAIMFWKALHLTEHTAWISCITTKKKMFTTQACTVLAPEVEADLAV